MGARLRSWRQKNKRLILIGVAIIVVLIAFASLVYIFGWNWTGFNGGYSKITTTRTTHGAITTTEQLPTKTFWDWIQLLAALAIPVVVGFGVAWFTTKQTQAQTQASEAANKQRHETELEITGDNQREAALQAYIDNISELLLEKHLRESQPEHEVRQIARVRTLTVLPRLDGRRKRSVLQFLYESNLIDRDKPIVTLYGADLSHTDLKLYVLLGVSLSGASLRKANLWGADLSGADLSHADLREANLFGAFLGGTNLSFIKLGKADLSGSFLTGANLHFADLQEADIYGADLSDADLKAVQGVTIEELEKKARSLKGATMTDGSKHP